MGYWPFLTLARRSTSSHNIFTEIASQALPLTLQSAISSTDARRYVLKLLHARVTCSQEDERVYAPPVKRPRGIDPTVDVSGEDVLPEGYGDSETLYGYLIYALPFFSGLLTIFRRRPKAKSLSLIRRYNRHGALVIGAHPSGAYAAILELQLLLRVSFTGMRRRKPNCQIRQRSASARPFAFPT